MTPSLARKTALVLAAGAAALALGLAAPASAPAAPVPAPAAAPAPAVPRGSGSSAIIQVAGPADMAPVRAAIERHGGFIKKVYRWNAFLVATPLGSDSTEFSAWARTVDGVMLAQGNRTVRSVATATDPLYYRQWGVPKIGVPPAWDLTLGSGVSVAVLDTGIDNTHPDLAGQFVLRTNEVTPGNPPVDDDSHSHGTHVAGVIAALRDNGMGVAGIAPASRLYVYKILDSKGNGDDADAATAIYDVVNHTPCKVISMSFGAAGTSPVLAEAVAYAQSHGVLAVAAAGNSNTSQPFFPASITGVLGVGSVGTGNVRSSFSNYGARNVDVVAPGESILSTVRGGWGTLSGTSMATPFVSAVAAQLWSAHPGLTASEVASLLESSAQDLGSAGVDQYYGHGLVRVDRALTAAPDMRPPVTVSDAKATYAGNAVIRLSAEDNLFGWGVTHTYHRLDGGAQLEGSTISTNALGAHHLEFWSTDKAGNIEGAHTVDFTITPTTVPDTTPPTTTSDAASAYAGIATIHLLATDNGGGSGVAGTWYALDSGVAVEGSLVTTTHAGSHTLAFWSVDASGNTEPTVTVVFSLVLPAATVYAPHTPASVTRGRAFTAYSYLKPRHASGTYAVKLQCYRYQSGHWVLRKTVSAKVANYSSYSRYAARLSLPYRGRWRIRAYHADSTHRASYSGYRYLTVR